ncbi:MAG TPA: acyl carrier protein [Pseudonocardiaceae bacterium]|nr:acyl carrier protein [Pseudonocardiaceae bacterium]
MITVDEVAGLIRREMRGKLPEGTIIDESTSMDDLGLSSLQVAEIVFTLEEDHEIEFDPARAADAKTLGDLVALGNEAATTQV